MPTTVATCLWFEKGGLEAARHYVSLIPNSDLQSAFAPSPDSEPLMVSFTLAGVPYQILNGGPRHRVTEAVSIAVQTDTQEETDRLWNALVADGGREDMCGWCKDRWGVSWQVVPRALPRLLSQPDRAAGARVMQAMLQMRRIDIAGLERASVG